MAKIIEVKSLSKAYEQELVLKNVSFTVEEGSFCALLGENGAGKSTILKILIGSEMHDRGEALVLNEKIIDGDPKARENIGFVSEHLNFDLPLTLREFVTFYKQFYPKFSAEIFTKLVTERRFDISKKFSECSRGQKMQFALILAIAIQPKVLLIDEVTSVLDIYARKYFMNVLYQFVKNGGTVIMTTNIIAEVQNYASHLLLLKDGKIVINSAIREIPKFFTKIRKRDGFDHEIFMDKDCYWAGENLDGSSSYIIPSYLKTKYEVTETMIDRRSVQLDDIFIYFFNITTEVQDDEAA